MPLPEFVERQRFEHAAFDLAAGAEAPGEICRDADGDFRQGGGGAVVHVFFLPRPMSRTLSDIGISPSAPATCGRRGSMCSITHSTTSGSAPRSPIWTRSRTGPAAPPGECTRAPGLGLRTLIYSIHTTA